GVVPRCGAAPRHAGAGEARCVLHGAHLTGVGPARLAAGGGRAAGRSRPARGGVAAALGGAGRPRAGRGARAGRGVAPPRGRRRIGPAVVPAGGVVGRRRAAEARALLPVVALDEARAAGSVAALRVYLDASRDAPAALHEQARAAIHEQFTTALTAFRARS